MVLENRPDFDRKSGPEGGRDARNGQPLPLAKCIREDSGHNRDGFYCTDKIGMGMKEPRVRGKANRSFYPLLDSIDVLLYCNLYYITSVLGFPTAKIRGECRWFSGTRTVLNTNST